MKSAKSRLVLVPAVAVLLLLTSCTDKNASVLTQEGEAYRGKGEFKAAIIQFKNALKQDPKSAEARYGLARTFLEAGDAQSAEQEFRKARALGIGNADLQFGLARSLLLQNNPKAALSELKDLPNATPEARSRNHALRAEAKFALDDVEGARSDYAQAIQLWPRNADALAGVARVELSLNELEKAEQAVNEAIAAAPDQPSSWIVKGDVAIAKNDIGAAAAAYANALKKDPKHTVAKYNLVLTEIHLGRLDDADRHLRELKAAIPENGLLHFQEGLIHYKRGKLREALAASERALQVQPNHVQSIILNGAAYFRLGAYEQAEQALTRALNAQPGNLYVRKLLVAALIRTKDRERAITVLAPALKAAPEDPQVLALASHVEILSGNSKKAEELIQAAIKLDPSSELLRTDLGLIQLLGGDVNAAMATLNDAAKRSPANPQATLNLLMAQLRANKFDDALVTLDALETKQPNDPAIPTLRGTTYRGKGDLNKARASYERALKLDPNYIPAITNLAELDIQENKSAIARQRFEAVLQRDKNNLAALVALAQFELAAGDTRKAIAWLERARAIKPPSVEARLRLAKLYLRSGQALSAVAIAAEATKLAPKNGEAIELLGSAQLAAGNVDNALATYLQLVQAYPNSPLAHYRIGVVRSMQGDHSASIREFSKAVELKPDFLDAKSALAAAYLKSGDLDKALQAARAIRNENPNVPVGHVLEADVLVRAKQPGEAVAAYQRAFKIAPSGLIASRLFVARTAAGDRNGAVAEMRKWLEAHPTDIGSRVLLADTYSTLGQMQAAAEQYEQVIKLEPDHMLALNNLALVYAKLNDPKALEVAARVHRLHPKNPYVLDTYGWLLVMNKQAERGLPLLEKAANELRQLPTVRYHFAAALAATGEARRARRELEAALAQDPNFEDAAAARRLLLTL